MTSRDRPILGVCAPSRAVCTKELDGTIDQARIEAANRYFHDRGWEMLEAANTRRIEQRFAGSDPERVDGIHAVFSNPDVDLVMALRGGYGAARLLNRLDYDRIAASKAPLVGLSDVTALELALLARVSKPSWQGPSFIQYAERDALRDQAFDAILQPGAWQVRFATLAQSLQVQGMLWGGNLSILTSLVGTPFMPDIEGGILLIEDVAEPAWRIERMLLTLHQAGILRRQSAILAGSFTNADRAEGSGQARFSLTDALTYISQLVSIPIVTGLPFGHIATSITVPVGVEATLASNEEGSAILRVEHPPRPVCAPGSQNWWT